MILATKGFASNPGASYGCLVWGDKFYTKWYKTDYAPNNPYWGPFNYYNTSGTNYTVDYNAGPNPGNGYINPSTQFQDQNQACFVKINKDNYVQGALGRWKTDVPLDDHFWFVMLVISSLGALYLSKNKLAFES